MIISNKELKVISQIALSEFTPVNGDYPESASDTETFSDCIDATAIQNPITGKELSGVVASLTKKNLIESDHETVSLTDTGYAMFKTACPNPESIADLVQNLL